MKIRSFRLLMMLGLIFSSVSVQAKQAPDIFLLSEIWDFGEVQSGEIAEHGFVIKNTGNAVLMITSLTPSCSCTQAVMKESQILPGKEAELKVTLDTTGKSGEYLSLVMIVSNDPDEPVKRVKVRAKIKK